MPHSRLMRPEGAMVTTATLLRALARLLLPCWFVFIDLGLKIPQLTRDGVALGADALIYTRSAAALLGGGDPWSASIQSNGVPYHFAGLPTDVLLYLPFAIIPEPIAVGIWLGLATLAAVWLLRRLHLPMWYLLFPPMVEGLYTANPQIPVLALLLAGAGPFAAALKVYAVLPMLGERRWRGLLATVVLFLALFVADPQLWFYYASHAGSISARLIAESAGGFSAWGGPPALFVATVVAIGIVALDNPRTAGWLIVPALWPASQIYNSTMVLPIITTAVAAALAFPWHGIPALVAIGYAGLVLIRRRPQLERFRVRWPEPRIGR